ncbi:MAG: tetratricopeptide repeat protein [Gemmatimonadetes bacterium]|nr:tetratricopeptide repeat protein [Gemmatimonadota bacterium]
MIDRALRRSGSGALMGGLVALATLLGSMPTQASGQTQASCAMAGAAAEDGWRLYRTGDIQAAGRQFNRALAACPRHLGALTGRGYVALRQGEVDEASRVFGSVLSADPAHVDALLGAGLAQSRLGRLAEAEEHFRAATVEAPDSPDAALGLARMAAWQGRHHEAERLYRSYTGRWPESTEAHLGLARALEAQGRSRAAHRALEEARRSAPQAPEVQAFADDMARSRRPSFRTSFVYESDSDRNRVRSTVVRAAWRPRAGIEVRWDAYLRESKVDRQFFLVRRAAGLRVGVATTLDAGWQLRAGVGGSDTNVTGSGRLGSFDASLATPGRRPVVAVLAFNRSPLDATSVLIERGVQVTSVTLEAQTNRASFGDGRLSLSWAGYEGIGSNRRWYSNLRVLARPSGPVRIGVDATVLGFSRNLNEGYFDPSSYVLALVPIQGRVSWNERWGLGLTVSPGIEHIGGGAGRRGALRGEGELSYSFPGGPSVSLGGIYATTGAQALWADEFGYRYFATSVGLSWQF